MSPPTSEQNKHLIALEDVASMIQKAQINIKKCSKQRLTEGYLKARLNTVDDYWEMFKQSHNELMKCTPREHRGIIPYFLNEEYYACEEMYLCLQGDINDLLSKLKTSDVCNMSLECGQTSLAKLPKIQLPTFSGKYEDWPTYQDLFMALVHNTSISNVQKLHYLKTSVSGEAERLLRHIHITDSNYDQAWELLAKRLGNKRVIVTTLLKRLFNQKKVTNQSASQIKSLLDTTTECINSLKNMKVCTEAWDPILVFLVGQKLDAESVKDWEQSVYKEDNDTLPTWNDMKLFLESRFRTLELINPTTAYPTREKPQDHKSFHVTSKEHEDEEDSFKSAHARVNTQPSCTYCTGEHYIFNCKDFVKQPVEQRKEFVQKSRLCFNCLKPNHNVYRCKHTTSCRVCRRKHHSLLHQVKETN